MYLQRNQSSTRIKGQMREGLDIRTVRAKKLINPLGSVRTPFQVVTLLQSLHIQKGLKLNRSVASYCREAKVFLDSYGSEKAERILLLSAEYANHSWGFIFLNKLAKEEQPKEEEREEREEMSPLARMIKEYYG